MPADTSARPRAALYARQSLDRLGEGAAVARQLDACCSLAEARGWEVVRVETDNDVSASSGKPRPGYLRLLDLVRSGAVDRVVVWHVDRLTRRLVDLEEVITACEGSGVGLATVTGDLDLSTDTGRMLARILTSVARGEVERKGTRQKAANRQRAEAGHMGWTRRPFGYAREDGRVVTVPAEADGLQRAAKAVLDGGTLAAAARDLDADGLTTSTGGRWSVTTLRRALLSPRYAGRSSYLGADVAAGDWPVILDADTQERLSVVLRNVSRRVQQGTELRYLLSGTARCGRCDDRRLYATPTGTADHPWQVYKCKSCGLTRRADLVDEVVVGVVQARLVAPDASDLLASGEDVEGLRQLVVDLRERRDALAGLIAEGLLGAVSGREQAQGLTARLRAAEADLERATGSSPAAALIGADDVRESWEGLTVRQRRAVVDELMTVTVLPAGKGVRWNPEQVRIDWSVA